MLRTLRHVWRMIVITRCLARHNALFPLERLPDFGAWDVRKYGRNILAFYVKGAPAPEAPVEAPPVEAP